MKEGWDIQISKPGTTTWCDFLTGRSLTNALLCR